MWFAVFDKLTTTFYRKKCRYDIVYVWKIKWYWNDFVMADQGVFVYITYLSSRVGKCLTILPIPSELMCKNGIRFNL